MFLQWNDFYNILLDTAEGRGSKRRGTWTLKLFVTGALNIFNHQTNVDVDNRFTVYGIRDLGYRT